MLQTSVVISCLFVSIRSCRFFDHLLACVWLRGRVFWRHLFHDVVFSGARSAETLFVQAWRFAGVGATRFCLLLCIYTSCVSFANGYRGLIHPRILVTQRMEGQTDRNRFSPRSCGVSRFYIAHPNLVSVFGLKNWLFSFDLFVCCPFSMYCSMSASFSLSSDMCI